MFRKILIKFMRSIGYVRKEHLTLAHLEIRGLEKEKYAVAAHCEKLVQTVNDLKNEIVLLTDENQSLWDMLDEIQGSNNFGKDQVKSIMQDLEEVLTDEMLKDFKPIGEA
mgnify:CR=1 FL=1|tara:strand:- start:899 stop:1228 length:330 start_codon:yes stop_codon:yes gene_type:complete